MAGQARRSKVEHQKRVPTEPDHGRKSKTFCPSTGREETSTPTPFGNKEERFACHEAILVSRSV